MTLAQYTELTGIAINSSNTARITAAIRKSKAILESLLGYSLTTPTGASDRDFPYVTEDINKHIDPAITVHSISVVKNGEIIEALDADDYSLISNRGLIKYFRHHNYICGCRIRCGCDFPLYEYRVNADWAFATLPDDILGIWADMASYYGNPKFGIKSETLGPHSYTRDLGEPAENDTASLAILRRYAGPRGSLGILPV